MKRFFFPAVFVLLAAAVAGSYWFAALRAPKLAYINMEELYNEFPLKKELEKKLEQVRTQRQVQLDSLRYSVDLLSVRLQSAVKSDPAAQLELEELRRRYFTQEQQAAQSNQATAEQYTEQIWGQLNQYVKDFGAAHDYQFIFGAAGEGRMMYAQDGVNITPEIKQYVNARYHGQAKE